MFNRRNNWQGEGNLTREPEVHTTKNGAEVVHFSVAISGAGSGTGEKDSAGFFEVKMWLTDSDYSCAADVNAAREGFKSGKWTKGTRVFINGRLSHETWKTESGEGRSKVIIMADRVEEMYSRNSDTPRDNNAVDTVPAKPKPTVQEHEYF